MEARGASFGRKSRIAALVFVIDTGFLPDGYEARVGKFMWRMPGSQHETHSAEGCVILAIYRKPNIFRDITGF